jgi:hypothetical protein
MRRSGCAPAEGYHPISAACVRAAQTVPIVRPRREGEAEVAVRDDEGGDGPAGPEPTESAALGSGAPLGVSVVVPAHDNADTLAELAGRLKVAFDGRPLEIVMVDDASTDASLDVIRSLGVACVALPRQCGQNAALLAGLARCSQPIACVMDADLEDPPEAMPALVDRLAAGDVRVAFSTRDGPRAFSSWLFRKSLRLFFPSLPRIACLCFALDAAARAALLAAAAPRDYLVAVIGALRLPAAAVPIRRGRRPSATDSAYAGTRRVRYAARMLGATARLRLRPPSRLLDPVSGPGRFLGGNLPGGR